MRFIIKIFVSHSEKLFVNILFVVVNVVPVQVVQFHIHQRHQVVKCKGTIRKNAKRKRRKRKNLHRSMAMNREFFKLEEIMVWKHPMEISRVEKIVHHQNIIRAFRTATQCLVLLFYYRRTHLILLIEQDECSQLKRTTKNNKYGSVL